MADSKTTYALTAVCPFYAYHTRLGCPEQYIACLGIPSQSKSIHVLFSSKSTLACYRKKHCESFEGYPKCPIYRALETACRECSKD